MMAVTKTHPFACVRMAMEEGIHLFGENRVQEAGEKWVGPSPDAELHLIGHLQRNKARAAAALFHTIQSIDKVETATELHRWCDKAGRRCDVLLEVNTSGERSKGGVWGRDALLALLEAVCGLATLVVRGLMTVGPFTGDAASVRASFAELRGHQEACRSSAPDLRLDILSMGMSGDYEIAVEEGSTLVRLGTALFGPRAPRA
jgi:hypothetical protein